ncbi:MAG TPA: RIP metalloprotease RseP [Firmicutes bacterium]|jgi:regulator of sigma E protease|nr:MAG: hypothetical protein AA931_03130 [Peptococcaceae bacterium 1109]HHT72494.1 RIP metalloprotease RseP [Bacillota bacterium]
MLTLAAFVVVFGTIVLFHELGHFLVAKLAGIRVFEFAIGFGPKVAGVRWGETTYSLRLFPLGGFVKMAGMDEAEDIRDDVDQDDPRSFANKSLPWRLSTIAAGPFMNFVLAILLFTIYFSLAVVPPTITQIEQHAPAYQAGLHPGDEFVEINGKPVKTSEDVVAIIQAHPGEELSVLVKRSGQFLTIPVTPKEADGKGVIGVAIDYKPRFPLGVSLQAGFTQTWQMAGQLITGLVHMVTGKVEPNLSGPIGIAQIVGQSARQGLASLLILAVVLNVNLGLLNLLPVPILDGGWLVILIVEALRGKPLAPESRGIAQFVGLAVLILLMLFATFQDISRLNWFS